jgi:hypothetical protein
MNINTLTAGTTLDFLTEVTEWPATDGWTLTYYLRGVTSVDLEATAEGADYRVSVAASVTALWGAGTYAWEARVELAGVVNKVASGTLTVLADLTAVAAGYDGRSYAKKGLDICNALLAGFTDVEEYAIAGRSLRRMNRLELLEARSQLMAEVAAEEAAAAVAVGMSNPRRLYVRM